MGGGENELIIKATLDAAGFKKGTKELSGAVKGLTSSLKGMFGRIAGVASVIGVLHKAISTYMSQNEQLSKQMDAAWTALGNALGPIINQIITWVTSAVSYLVEFMRLLGLTSKTASDASKAAKKSSEGLNRTVAGFDELNKLSAGGKGDATLENKEAPEWIKDIADFLKKGEWEAAATVLADKLNAMVSSVNWQEIGEKIGYFFDGALKFLATFITQFDWMNLASKLTEGINGFMNSVDWRNLAKIMGAKFRIILLSLVGFINTFDWKGFGKAIGDYFRGAFESMTDTIKRVDWGALGLKLWDALCDMLEGVDWEGLIKSAFEFLGTALGAISIFLLEFCYGIIEDIVNGLFKAIDFFGQKIEDAGGDVAQGILDGILEIWGKIKEWVKNNILDPFIKGFKEVFKIASPSKVMEEQGKYIINGMLDGLKSAWIGVTTWVSGLWNSFNTSLSGLINGARRWGSDLINNFIGGMDDKKWSLSGAVSSIAQGIRNVLAFSEPKEGPLSDFHTYGPDMMDLYASGIESASGKVFSAVNDVAQGVSNTLNGDVGGLSAVASGVVTPYATNSAFGSNGGGDIVSQISNAVYEAVMAAMEGSQGGGQHTTILEVNGREFCRATYYDQQEVAMEHGISLISR